MQKLLIIFMTFLIISSHFLEVKASDSILDLATKNKVEKIIETFIYKVENKYNWEKQLIIYNKFNDKIIHMWEWMSWKKLWVIDYISELMKSKITLLNTSDMKNILIDPGENKNIDNVLSIEYVDVELPEGKSGYAWIILSMKIAWDKKEFNLDLDLEKEFIVWQWYKITILNAELYEPLKMNIEKIDTNDILKDKLLNYNNYSDDEINNILSELDTQEKPIMYSESLVDPDDSYHTYIELRYNIIWLTIYQYDGKITNVEEILK